MEMQTMFEQIKGHVNGFTVTLLALFVVSEILGSNDRVKASSIYGIIKTLLATLKDQVWPMALKADPVQVTVVTPEATPAPVQAPV